jgi:DNA-binding transcriptional MerR regulator
MEPHHATNRNCKNKGRCLYSVWLDGEEVIPLLKIGDFARIGQISIKALRHYDALGLLRPAHTHLESGYRFYDLAQLSELARILARKDCGFSLEEIAQLLRTHDADEITEMLRARVQAQRELIATEEARLQRITARLSQLAPLKRDDLRHDVVLKRSEPLNLLACIHHVCLFCTQTRCSSNGRARCIMAR